MSNKTLLVRCSHCKKIFSTDNFEAHKCDLQMVGVKNIPVVYFMDTSCKGKKFMTGYGIDGILYTFEVTPRKPIPVAIRLSDEFLQAGKSDEDLTESFIVKNISYFCSVNMD